MWNAQAQGGSGGSYPTQWALNPAAYANTPNEQVDWASLAQQWIKMKETMGESAAEAIMAGSGGAGVTPSVVPGPPQISAASQVALAPGPDGSVVAQAGWPDVAAGGAGWWEGSAASQATWNAAAAPSTWYQEAPPPPPPPAPSYSFQPAPPPPPQYSNNSQNYWSGGSKEWGAGGGHSHRSHNNRRTSGSYHQHSSQADLAPPSPQIDAMKRKQLPAWIREGLEKMEREKLKRAEMERYSRENEGDSKRDIVEDRNSSSRTNVNGSPPPAPINHVVDSGSESDASQGRESSPAPAILPRKSPTPSPPPPKTKEEIFQSVMLGVRRILTQLLMDVTGEEMKKIAETVLKKHRRKGIMSTVALLQYTIKDFCELFAYH